MKFIRITLTSILILVIQNKIFAQNPPSIHWKQLTSKHFNIIYPQGCDSIAKESAKYLEKAYIVDTTTYKTSIHKTDIFLFTEKTTSNAYSRLAPRQMIWYTTPSPNVNLSLTPWLKLLSIHEFRHIVQFKAFDKGIPHILSFLFGQYGLGFGENYIIPSWFWEGDAVYNETIYSNNGRGRISDFDLPIRTMLLSGKPPKFEKFLFRSYKEFYPNHYYFGYFMVSHINRNYGQDIWYKIAHKTTLLGLYPFAFSHSLKKLTGYNTKKTFYNAMCELDSLWTEKYKHLDTSKCIFLQKKKKRTWTNYTSGFQITDDTLIFLKSGLDQRPTITLLYNGKEKKIKEIAATSFSYAKNIIVWAQKQPHIRWTEKDYSQIAILNLNSKKIKQITHKGKFFSPYISNNGKTIVAIQNYRFKTNITLLNTNGQIIKILPNIHGDFIRFARPNKDASKIVFTHSNNKGQALSIIDTKTEKIKNLIDYQWIRITKPIFYKNYILFNWDPDGIANIYAIDTTNKSIYKITSRPFGLGDFQVIKLNGKDFLLFSDYSINGYNPAIMPININNWQKVNKISDTRLKYFLNDKKNTNLSKLYDNQNIDTNFKISDYKKTMHLFNFHSWYIMPTMNNLDLSHITFTLLSDNKLHTASTSIGIQYFTYKPAFFSFVNFKYYGFFPIINTGIGIGTTGIADTSKIYLWKQKQAYIDFDIPLNFTRGLYNRSIETNIRTSYININSNDTIPLNSLSQGNNLSINASIALTNKKFADYRDITSRFGQYLKISYFGLYLPKSRKINRTLITAKLYIPGIMRHHSIVISANTVFFNKINTNYIAAINLLPNGYKPYFKPYKNAFTYSLEYYMPLLYPDFGINPIIYFKRLRTTLFYQQYISMPAKENLTSVGVNLITDFHLFRYNLYMLNAGVQIAYLVNEKKFNFTPIFMDVSIPF